MQLRAIDLFAGIGGIRLGFEQAMPGIQTVFASEFDKAAVRTYAANFDTPGSPVPSLEPMSEHPFVYGDVTRIGEGDVPPFDVCLAGFPCQAFSMAGRRMGFEDDYYGRTRGTLFREVVRICRHHRPKAIFCENVKGLVRHDGGRTLATIVGAFEEIGYVVRWKVLDSRDFGVPQGRERIYVVCFRSDVDAGGFSFPEPDGRRGACIRDILEDAPIPSRYYLSDTYLDFLRRHRERHAARGNGFGYVIRDLDGAAGTVVTGGMGRERNLIVDAREHSMVPTTRIKGSINWEDVRKLTPREWARLQGFPDSFRLVGADSNLYRQLGNSVTVPVIRAVAERMGSVLGA